MYLVDTSVLISYFRGIKNSAIKHFNTILDDDIPFGITGVIYQEILQSAASKQDFISLKNYLSTQRFFHPKDNILIYESAAKLFYNCRRNGITLRSTIDCLIAQIAIEHDLTLLHHDQDYERIQSVAKTLRLLT